MNIKKRLFELRDAEYAKFQAKLNPTVAEDRIIGVRVPEVTKLAKELIKEDYHSFMKELPHKYFDEDMLHGKTIALIKDYDECIREVDRFLPYIDNWAVCDSMSPKVFKKHKMELNDKILEWMQSEDTYTCRFGIKTAMDHFLDEDFNRCYLDMAVAIQSDEYYVKMMVAFYFATALAKRWDATLPYITQHKLDPWTHRKTIQKAGESYRITYEQKQFLNSLK